VLWSVKARSTCGVYWCRTCHCQMNCVLHTCWIWQWTTCSITSWMLEGRASGKTGLTFCGTELVASERFVVVKLVCFLFANLRHLFLFNYITGWLLNLLIVVFNDLCSISQNTATVTIKNFATTVYRGVTIFQALGLGEIILRSFVFHFLQPHASCRHLSDLTVWMHSQSQQTELT